jgi:hypothetical protein
MSNPSWVSPSEFGTQQVVNGFFDGSTQPPVYLIASFPLPLPATVRSEWSFVWTGINDRYGNVSPNPSPDPKTSTAYDVNGQLSLGLRNAYSYYGTLLISSVLFDYQASTRVSSSRILKVVYTPYDGGSYAPGTVTWSFIDVASVEFSKFWTQRIGCTETL